MDRRRTRNKNLVTLERITPYVHDTRQSSGVHREPEVLHSSEPAVARESRLEPNRAPVMGNPQNPTRLSYADSDYGYQRAQWSAFWPAEKTSPR